VVTRRLTPALATAVLLGCKTADNAYVATGPLARVLVDSAGAVFLNSHRISQSALADSFQALNAAGGAVIYSRRPYSPHPTAGQDTVVKQVLAAIVNAKLPVRLVHPDSLALPDSVLRK
jgi:hypothetical protein